MKTPLIIVLFFIVCSLSANDYKWDLVNALSKNDYPAAEKLINDNIKKVPAAEKPLIMNFALTYSHGDTSLQVLNLLQKHNVRPSAFDLYTAIGRNQPDFVINFILSNGARANGEILLLAMEKQRYDFAHRFINEGADVNYHYPLARNYADGMTSLLHASKNNNFELVKLLVEKGAVINARDKSGNTPLSYALLNQNVQISDFLLERGAVFSQNNTVFTNQQNGGLGSFFDTFINEFKPGSYRLSKSNTADARIINFSGSAGYGVAGFIRNGRVYSGSYQSANGNLTIILEGRSVTYKIDSENSFSGNGEVWEKTGN